MQRTVIVDTHRGRLRGVVERSFEDYDYWSFKGVPYAKPPVGELRFKDPVPVEPWVGIREATEYGSMCLQADYFGQDKKNLKGSEDCLYLNVYVKPVKKNERLPVMVWIHGGGFMFGCGDDFNYGPDYLLRKDIVLVTINYRLGIFGFLNLESEVAPGNQGLKDQILALKWVQENIEKFGGNPNNVTIFGESAGAASVHYLALSSLTKGLFHKAIAQSSVACNSWACLSSKKNALKVCRALGNNSTDPKELVEFLRTIDCDTLTNFQNDRDLHDRITQGFLFSPGVDDKAKEPVMPIHPADALENGVHVPLMIGYNNREGIFFLIGQKDLYYDKLNEDFEKYLFPDYKKMLQQSNTTPQQVREYYFGKKKITKELAAEFVDFKSDAAFVRGIHRTLTHQVKNKFMPTYFYKFTYDIDHSLIKMMANCHLSGAAHFDEVPFLFSMGLYDLLSWERPKKGSTSYRIMEQMTEMWTNFAKYGNPTPTTSNLIPTHWLPVTNGKVFQALNISEELKMINVMSLEVLTSSEARDIKNKL